VYLFDYFSGHLGLSGLGVLQSFQEPFCWICHVRISGKLYLICHYILSGARDIIYFIIALVAILKNAISENVPVIFQRFIGAKFHLHWFYLPNPLRNLGS